jgi:hypothetical protein
MTNHSISARFGGRDMTFCIPRQHLSIFENIHGPAALMMQRFTQRAWTVENVRAVLEFAARPEADFARAKSLPGGMGSMVEAILPAADPHIKATLTANAPGAYVELAMLVLVASLYGLEPGDAASWTDEAPVDGVPADGE